MPGVEQRRSERVACGRELFLPFDFLDGGAYDFEQEVLLKDGAVLLVESVCDAPGN